MVSCRCLLIHCLRVTYVCLVVVTRPFDSGCVLSVVNKSCCSVLSCSIVRKLQKAAIFCVTLSTTSDAGSLRQSRIVDLLKESLVFHFSRLKPSASPGLLVSFIEEPSHLE